MKMMKTFLHKLTSATLLAAAALAAALPAAAESNTVSPYSRFGYGTIESRSNTAQKAMGGVGYAMRSGREINFMNPASYAAMDSLTFLFDMGVDIRRLSSTEGSEKGSHFTGGLNYITLQAPLAKWIAASAGLMPVTSVGYKFGDEITNGETAHQGTGDLNLLYLGVGVKPFKGFTAGVNVGYLFGTLVNSDYIYAQNDATSSFATSLFERQIEVRDYSLRLGLQYGLQLTPEHEVTLGVVYEPAKSLHGHARGVKYDVSGDAIPDTLANLRLANHSHIPNLWGAGISYGYNKQLLVEADFSYQPWKGVKYPTIKEFGDYDSQFSNRWQVNLGAQYIPRPRGSWVQRVNYRLGCYLTRDYITVRGNNVREFGITAGLGLPAPMSKTMVNLSVEYRNRRATPTPLVKEQYLIVTLGINFNELWFWRNKLR